MSKQNSRKNNEYKVVSEVYMSEIYIHVRCHFEIAFYAGMKRKKILTISKKINLFLHDNRTNEPKQQNH